MYQLIEAIRDIDFLRFFMTIGEYCAVRSMQETNGWKTLKHAKLLKIAPSTGCHIRPQHSKCFLFDYRSGAKTQQLMLCHECQPHILLISSDLIYFMYLPCPRSTCRIDEK